MYLSLKTSKWPNCPFKKNNSSQIHTIFPRGPLWLKKKKVKNFSPSHKRRNKLDNHQIYHQSRSFLELQIKAQS